jgi:hypothetical protein
MQYYCQVNTVRDGTKILYRLCNNVSRKNNKT